MVDPTLTISIDRTSLSLSPLVFVGSGAGALGIADYREPAMQPRVRTSPASDVLHGDGVPLSWAWQQAILSWSFFTDDTTETESRALLAEVRAAVGRLNFEVTVTVNGAPAETWSCNPGPISPESSRDYLNLRDSDPVWSVSLPCYPIREVA